MTTFVLILWMHTLGGGHDCAMTTARFSTRQGCEKALAAASAQGPAIFGKIDGVCVEDPAAVQR